MTKIATTPNDMTTQVGYLKELQNYLVHLRLECADAIMEGGGLGRSYEDCKIIRNYLEDVINDLQTDINDLS